MTELKPCPFCGSANVAVEHDEEYWNVVFGSCLACNTQGPTVEAMSVFEHGVAHTRDGAIADAKVRAAELWNQRT